MLCVKRQHLTVVLSIDMIAGQHQHVIGNLAPDDVYVLEHCIGSTHIPFVGITLRRRQYLHTLPQLLLEMSPATHKMPDQRVCLVLGHNPYPSDAGVDAVGERKIDDAELASKEQRGLGTPIREFVQARAPSPREDQSVGPAGELTDVTRS